MHGEDENRWSVLATSDQRDFFIATIENGAPGDTLATEEANARLVAAAPEMLEALKGAVSMLEHSYLGENPEDNPIMDSIQAWRAVIDKVTNRVMSGK